MIKHRHLLPASLLLLSTMAGQAAIIEEHHFPASAGLDHFATDVAIDANQVYVGAGYAGGGGQVHVYDTATGASVTTLTPSNPAASDNFGIDLALSGNTLAVGGWNYSDPGEVHLFDTTTNTQTRVLTASDSVVGDAFGAAVAISGNTVVVGAERQLGHEGSAYVFDAHTGNELFKLRADDAGVSSYFGRDVAVSGNLAVIGANTGVYIFDLSTGNQLHKLTSAQSHTNFGEHVAIDGTTVVISEHDSNGWAGAAHVYDALTGNLLDTLLDPDGGNDGFGKDVDITDGRIGVSTYSTNNGNGTGTAHFFDASNYSHMGSLPTPSTNSVLLGKEIHMNGGLIAASSSGAGTFTFRDTSFSSSVPNPASLPLVMLGVVLLFAVPVYGPQIRRLIRIR